MPQQNVTEPDPTNVPPYKGRTTGRRDDDISEALTGTVERQLDETKTGRPGATASPADESPVRPDEVASPGAAGAGTSTATDPNATTAHGVGTNMTRRGEDVVEEEGENGRRTTGTQGEPPKGDVLLGQGEDGGHAQPPARASRAWTAWVTTDSRPSLRVPTAGTDAVLTRMSSSTSVMSSATTLIRRTRARMMATMATTITMTTPAMT